MAERTHQCEDCGRYVSHPADLDIKDLVMAASGYSHEAPCFFCGSENCYHPYDLAEALAERLEKIEDFIAMEKML